MSEGRKLRWLGVYLTSAAEVGPVEVVASSFGVAAEVVYDLGDAGGEGVEWVRVLDFCDFVGLAEVLF